MNHTIQLNRNDAHSTTIWATTLSVKVIHQAAIEGDEGAENLLREIGRYFEVMCRLIEEQGGFVKKFDGEQLIALFHTEMPQEAPADRSVSAAIAIMEQLNDLNLQRQSAGLPPFRLGIGVNTGQVLLGIVPSMQFPLTTLLGEGVEAATYLGNLNTQTPFHNVFISESTLSSLHNRNGYLIENLGQVYLPNTAKPLQLYALAHPT